MMRKVSVLADKVYDLIVVGGGIFGICAAWDAALRGLSVAIIERGDFAHATSGNCFKIVHGGIRYIQHLDFSRVRESSHERNVLLRIAPHLVHPLPIVVPTYGHGLQGKEFLCAGLMAYGLITLDRNKGLDDPERRIPLGHIVSREDCLRQFPGLKNERLTGAMIFYDGQMYSPARLALSFLKKAVDFGAEAANYLEATGFLYNQNRVWGVKATDRLTGDALEIRGKLVLNAAGPWAEHLLSKSLGVSFDLGFVYSRDIYFIVARRLLARHALALKAKNRDPDAIVSRGYRHLFLVPWREHTLIGVWHAVYTGERERFTVTERDLQGFVNEVNEAYPTLSLKLADISMWNAGLVLAGHNKATRDVSYGKRSQLVDHAKTDTIDGLVTMIGVRYTTARAVAEKAVDLIFKKLGKNPPRSRTAATPIYGGDVGCFDKFMREAIMHRPPALSAELMPNLLRNHGSKYREVLKYIDEDPACAEPVWASKVTRAEVIHAIRKEMAHKLADVVFRRTDLGSGGDPGELALRGCAELMASELGWNRERLQKEFQEVRGSFPQFSAGRGAGEPTGSFSC
jgi:glycerol-3-phosphate dehydrogenase